MGLPSNSQLTLKPGAHIKCMACEAALYPHRQYPAQPLGVALELWCRACRTINVYYYMGGITIERAKQ